MSEKEFAVFNPSSRPVEELPVIFGFNNGGPPGWMSGLLLAEDGTPLGGHLCTNEGYMRGDLGTLPGSRPDRHIKFQSHYPDGYRIQFVPYDQVQANEKLMAAIRLSEAASPSPTENADEA